MCEEWWQWLEEREVSRRTREERAVSRRMWDEFERTEPLSDPEDGEVESQVTLGTPESAPVAAKG